MNMARVTTIALASSAIAWAGTQSDGERKPESEIQATTHSTATFSRVIRKQAVVAASPAEVWQAWTTSKGVESFMGRPADIDLKVGGKFEIFFAPDAPAGSRGSEGCRVLAYLPFEMLAFSWNAPPSIPELRAKGPQTQVVLQFEEVGDNRTKVSLSHHDIGDGPLWDKYVSYFEPAWTNVLTALEKRFATETEAGQ